MSERPIRCPACGAPFYAHLTEALPFCSERCRSIDLGRWLDEAYAFPTERSLEEESDEDETSSEDSGEVWGRAVIDDESEDDDFSV